MENSVTHPAVPVLTLADTDRVCVGTTFRGNIATGKLNNSDSVDYKSGDAGANSAAGDAYSEFSLCHYVGDAEAHWRDCRRRLAQHLGVELDRLIVPRQTHSVNVAVVRSIPVGDADIEGVDALVTTLPGVVVGVNTADCLPLLLYDEQSGVVAAVHAGWRGAVGGVVENAVAAMIEQGAHPADIHAIVAPHIGVCCFEVGEEVAERFHPDDVVRHAGAKPHVSLAGAVTRTLRNLGVDAANICADAECTRCRSTRYFSARALGIASGRNFSFISLKKQA
jgi:hypothetical protein